MPYREYQVFGADSVIGCYSRVGFVGKGRIAAIATEIREPTDASSGLQIEAFAGDTASIEMAAAEVGLAISGAARRGVGRRVRSGEES